MAPQKPIYTAIFLDDASVDALKKRYPPKHSKVHAHHVTLVFRPSPKDLEVLEPHIGTEVLLDVVGEACDDRGQAAKVTVPPFLRLDEQVHHITISCAETISPVYSNELLKKGWPVIEPFLQLKGTVRHFTK